MTNVPMVDTAGDRRDVEVGELGLDPGRLLDRLAGRVDHPVAFGGRLDLWTVAADHDSRSRIPSCTLDVEHVETKPSSSAVPSSSATIASKSRRSVALAVRQLLETGERRVQGVTLDRGCELVECVRKAWRPVCLPRMIWPPSWPPRLRRYLVGRALVEHTVLVDARLVGKAFCPRPPCSIALGIPSGVPPSGWCVPAPGSHVRLHQELISADPERHDHFSSARCRRARPGRSRRPRPGGACAHPDRLFPRQDEVVVAVGRDHVVTGHLITLRAL